MPDWFVFLGLASLVGGLVYFVQLVVSLLWRLFTSLRDLIDNRRPIPAVAYRPLVDDVPRGLRDRAL